MRKTVLFLTVGMLVSLLFAQTAFSPLQAETTTAVAPGNESITIRSNVRKAAVYLNGTYEGNTTLTLKKLMRGQYHLRVEKNGYEAQNGMISVVPACAQEFFIELKKIPRQKTEQEDQ